MRCCVLRCVDVFVLEHSNKARFIYFIILGFKKFGNFLLNVLTLYILNNNHETVGYYIWVVQHLLYFIINSFKESSLHTYFGQHQASFFPLFSVFYAKPMLCFRLSYMISSFTAWCLLCTWCTACKSCYYTEI